VADDATKVFGKNGLKGPVDRGIGSRYCDRTELLKQEEKLRVETGLLA
jgi:hypothetical protein